MYYKQEIIKVTYAIGIEAKREMNLELPETYLLSEMNVRETVK